VYQAFRIGQCGLRHQKHSSRQERLAQNVTLLIGNTAPGCTAETNEGRLRLRDRADDHWVVCIPHSDEFATVCTSQLGHTSMSLG
jgi:hypothetical protein